MYRICLEPRCPEPALPGKGRCVLHAAEYRKQTRSPFNSFYASKPWRIARRKQLYDHPLCEYALDGNATCGALAEHVRHMVDLKDGGAPRDPATLQSLCAPHHRKISMERQPG